MLKTFLTASLDAIGTIATPIHAFSLIGDLSAGDPTFNTGSITGAGNATLVTPVPFEFSPVLGLGVLGGLFATKKLIQKYATHIPLLKEPKNN